MLDDRLHQKKDKICYNPYKVGPLTYHSELHFHLSLILPFPMIRSTLTFISCLTVFSMAGQLPPDFHDEVYLNGFDFPTGVTFDANGRGYVWENPGRIQMIDTLGRPFPEPLLDIHEEVSNWKDHGLMGFCLDNDFLENGYIYLLYALDRHYYDYYGSPAYHPDSSVLYQPTIGRVTRFTADPATDFTTVIPGSRKVLLGETIENGIPLLYAYHGLGSLIMATDRTLLISCGDATSNISADIGGDSLETPVTPALAAGVITPDQDVGSYRAQYLGSYNGKIIRIDPETGDGLPSNPFYDPAAPRSAKSRIWAYGLRNPYRIMVRPETGSHYPADGKPGVIYAGDVGNGAWEELNIITRGGQNFGWPITEGLHYNWDFQKMPAPLNHLAPNKYYNDGACGAAFYDFRELFQRPSAQPTTVIPNPCNPSEPLATELGGSVESLPAIVWNNSRWNKAGKAAVPGFDAEGALKSVALDDPDCPVESELFNGFSSLAGVFYPQGGPYPEEYHGKYFGMDYSSWIKVFDFSETQELRSVKHFHSRADDIIHMTLNPKDSNLYYVDIYGAVNRISYGGNPAPLAKFEADQYFGPSPLEVNFDGTLSTDDSGVIAAYFWDFGDGNSSTEARPTHIFKADNAAIPQEFTVRLTVTDAQGLSRETTRIISLNNTPPIARISSIREGERYPTDETTVLRLSAEVSDAEHQGEDLQYEWRIYFHHNDHFHPEPLDTDPESFLVVEPLGCGEEIYYYRVVLKVTDAAGLSATDERVIQPYCADPFIALHPLQAQLAGNSVDLQWTTEFEDDLSEMIVQRSSDYFHFENIGSVNPVGNTTHPQQYTFVDPAPIRGNNIYRIKVRRQGAYTYTNLAVVAYPAPPAVTISPNPAQDFFTVQVRKANTALLRFDLYAVSGAHLIQSSWEASPGQAFEYQFLTNDLPAGVYFYRLLNGGETAAGQLVIR